MGITPTHKGDRKMSKIPLLWAEEFRRLVKKWQDKPEVYTSNWLVNEFLKYCDAEEGELTKRWEQKSSEAKLGQIPSPAPKTKEN